jgi:hypothetical protein
MRRAATPAAFLCVKWDCRPRHELVMPGLVPPARPKPLRRGEGPGIHVLRAAAKAVDGRDKPGHDGAWSFVGKTPADYFPWRSTLSFSF